MQYPCTMCKTSGPKVKASHCGTNWASLPRWKSLSLAVGIVLTFTFLRSSSCSDAVSDSHCCEFADCGSCCGKVDGSATGSGTATGSDPARFLNPGLSCRFVDSHYLLQPPGSHDWWLRCHAERRAWLSPNRKAVIGFDSEQICLYCVFRHPQMESVRAGVISQFRLASRANTSAAYLAMVGLDSPWLSPFA